MAHPLAACFVARHQIDCCDRVGHLVLSRHGRAQEGFADGVEEIACRRQPVGSWPKKSSKLFVDLTEDGIRAIVLPTGLVDVKVCAINEDWSGLKLMVRKELRSKWNI